MQMDMYLDLELSLGNNARIFTSWSLVQITNNSLLLGLSFSLDPAILADTPIKQCCDFSKDSLAFETDHADRDM